MKTLTFSLSLGYDYKTNVKSFKNLIKDYNYNGKSFKSPSKDYRLSYDYDYLSGSLQSVKKGLKIHKDSNEERAERHGDSNEENEVNNYLGLKISIALAFRHAKISTSKMTI